MQHRDDQDHPDDQYYQDNQENQPYQENQDYQDVKIAPGVFDMTRKNRAHLWLWSDVDTEEDEENTLDEDDDDDEVDDDANKRQICGKAGLCTAVDSAYINFPSFVRHQHTWDEERYLTKTKPAVRQRQIQ